MHMGTYLTLLLGHPIHNSY